MVGDGAIKAFRFHPAAPAAARLFAPHPIAVPVEMASISARPDAHRRGARGARRSTIGIIDRTRGTPNRRRSAALFRAMAVPRPGFAVHVAAIGIGSARMAGKTDEQD